MFSEVHLNITQIARLLIKNTYLLFRIFAWFTYFVCDLVRIKKIKVFFALSLSYSDLLEALW